MNNDDDEIGITELVANVEEFYGEFYELSMRVESLEKQIKLLIGFVERIQLVKQDDHS